MYDSYLGHTGRPVLSPLVSRGRSGERVGWMRNSVVSLPTTGRLALPFDGKFPRADGDLSPAPPTTVSRMEELV